MYRPIALVLLILCTCHAQSASAAPPSELARSCVAASTQGQIDRDEGRLLAARARFLQCASEDCPAIVRKSCDSWLSELTPRIPSVVIRVRDAEQHDITAARVMVDGAEVSLDGRPVLLDPGTHTIEVDAPGRAQQQRAFLLAEREQARLLVLELVDAPGLPPPPIATDEAAPSRPAQHARARYTVPLGSWLLGGVGLAGIATFTGLRIKAGRDLDQLDRRCAPLCSDAERDAGNRKTLTADVSLGIGIATLSGALGWALGSWLWKDRASDGPARRGQLTISPLAGGAFATLRASY